jgi:hypothetical protein
MIPDVAIGAVIAALIGAMISLVSLVVSKESKVSEFRQNWIVEIRQDLARFMTHLTAMEDSARVRFDNDKERFEKTRDSIAKLNEEYFAITLRLNPDEEMSKLVKSSMVNLAHIIADPRRDEVAINDEKVKFIESSNRLLKSEWVRVRDGERTYNRTKMTAVSVVFILLFGIVAFFIMNFLRPPTKSSNNRGAAKSVLQHQIPHRTLPLGSTNSPLSEPQNNATSTTIHKVEKPNRSPK